MKNRLRKLSLLLTAFMLFSISFTANAQQVTIGTGTLNSYFYGPLYRSSAASSFNHSHYVYIYDALELANIPNGALITEVAWEIATTNAMTGNNFLEIKMENTSQTTVPLTANYTAETSTSTTVFSSNTYQVPGTAGWHTHILNTPFAYGGGNLKIAVGHEKIGTTAGAINYFYEQATGKAGGMASSSNTASTTFSTSYSNRRPNIRITYLSGPCANPPVPGAVAATDTTICPGSSAVLNLPNSTAGVGQTFQWQSSPDNVVWTDITGATNATYAASPATNTYYRCNVTCGVSVASSSLQILVNGPSLSGTFTINANAPASATNFTSVTAAFDALSCVGISGPVVFNVAANSGPYAGRIEVGQIFGASATNTITLNGNGNTVSYAATGTNDRTTFLLNGTDWLTVDSLRIEATGATYGWVLQLTNEANNNTFTNCQLVTSTASTSTFFNNIALSGSITSATTAGNSGNNNTFTNNTLIGGYYGITLIGTSTTVAAQGNKFNNNIVQDFAAYGVYVSNQEDLEVKNNDISRATRTSVTSFYGISFFGNDPGAIIEGNAIHDNSNGALTSTSLAYPIYASSGAGTVTKPIRVVNNIVYNINSNGTQYGMYLLSNSFNWQIYHNTIVLDKVSQTGSSTIAGFYHTGLATGVDLKNNIFFINNGNTGTKYGLWYSNATAAINSNNNVVTNLSSSGTIVFGRSGTTNHATLVDWQTATSQDGASVDANPVFANATVGQLSPLSSSVNNIGAAVGVTADYTGAPRSATTPDPGAFEFTPVSSDLALISATLNRGICLSSTDTAKFQVENTFGSTLDFSVTPLTLNWNVTGPVNSNGSILVNTGTLAVSGILNLNAVVNMSAAGIYTLNAHIAPNTYNAVATNDSIFGITLNAFDPPFSVSPALTQITNPFDNAQITASSDFIPAISFPIVTEICHFRGSTNGAPAGGWPAYMIADDYIEITGPANFDMSGYTIEMWSASALNFSGPLAAGTVLSPSGTAILATGQLGSSVPSPANYYYHLGNTGTLGSTTAQGYIIKNGTTIIDAVFMGTGGFPAAAGVTASDWSGTFPALSSAGARLEGFYTKNADNWTNSGTAGNNNGQNPNQKNVPVHDPNTIASGLVWSLNGTPLDSTAVLTVGPFGVGQGSNTYVATFNGPCGSITDTAVVEWNNPFVCPPGAVCATNANAISSTLISSPTATSVSACPGDFEVVIPAGNVITSVEIEYDMVAQSGAWLLEQRSRLTSPTNMSGENLVSGPSSTSGGTASYSRSNLIFAAGLSDTVDFMLHIIRTWGGSTTGAASCDTIYQYVPAGAANLIVYYGPAPSCNAPTGVVASNPTGSSINLNWNPSVATNPVSYLVQYGVTGFTPGTGTVVAALDTFTTVSGLMSSTTYDFYVATICTGADTGAYTLLPASATTSFVCPPNAICETYTAGNGSSEYNISPSSSSLAACPTTVTVAIPTGNVIYSMDVDYDITAHGGAWLVEQASRIYSPTTSTGEATLTNGPALNSAGTASYSRQNLTFANGAAGNVDVQLHAFRTWGGSGCDTIYQYVNNGSYRVIAYYGPDTTSSFALLSPPNNTLLTLQGPGATTVQATWESAGPGANYTWMVDAPTGNFSSPLAALPSDNSGADTVITLTYTDIDLLLASLNVNVGDTVPLKWTVRAISGTDTVFADQEFNLTIIRGQVVVTQFVAAPLNNNATTGLRAPNGTAAHTYHRAASIVLGSEFATAGIGANDGLRGLGFTLSTPSAGGFSGIMKVYLQNTTDATYLKGTSWTGITPGMTLFYEDTVFVPLGATQWQFSFDSAFAYTGNNLYVAFDFQMITPAITPGLIYLANTALPGSLVSANSATAPPATLATTAFRPELRWEVLKRINDLEVSAIFAKGSNAIPYGSPEKVQAIIKNNGLLTANKQVTLTVSGANTGTFNANVSNLVDGQSAVIDFNFTATNTGFTTFTVSVPNDEFNGNNTRTWVQNVTNNIYSYSDTTLSGLGGVGFNTGSGLLLNRYRVNGTRSVSAINVRISDNTAAVGNTVYAVVLDKDSNIVATSDSVVLATADLQTWKTFALPTPPTIANEAFWVGIAQTANATGYFPVAFQNENPTRDSAYWAASIAGTGLSTVNGFRLMIQAVLNVPDTLEPFALISPPNNTNYTATGQGGVTITWEATQRAVGTAPVVTYEWLVDLPTGNFTTPLAVLPSQNSGLDTVLTLSDAQINALLAANNIPVGVAATAIWTVRATSGTLTRFADTAFTVVLTGTNPCSDPTTINATADCNSATVTWNSGTTKASSFIQYGPTGFTPGTGTIVTTGSSPYTITALTPGTTYDIWVSDSCSDGGLSAYVGPFTVTTDSLPVASFTANSPSIGVVDVDASATTHATSYDWNYGDGNSGTGVTASHTYASNGNYTITLIATGPCGADTTTQPIQIDGIGIEQYSLNTVSLYPNPSNGVFTINGIPSTNGNVSIEVNDALGRVIYTHTLKDGETQTTLSLSNLRAGTYMVSLRNAQGKVVKPIVIK